MDNSEKIEFYKNQQKLEDEIIVISRKAIEGIDNHLITILIESITIDSEKHKRLLEALKTLATSSTPFIAEKVSETIKNSIQMHIKLESEAIRTYKELLEKVEDGKERVVLEAIYKDEVRHHSLLQKIYKKIVEQETLNNDEIWEFYTREVMPQY